MEDKMLTCLSCQDKFAFTKGEQEFFAERGFVEPKRCPSCRRKRRGNRQSSVDDLVGRP